MRAMIRSLPIVLVLLSASVARADFSAILFETGEDSVRALRARDLTGDGRIDLVAFTDGPRGTAVHVFDVRAPAGAPSRAAVVVRPDELGLRDIYYACLARTDGNRPPEIVFADRRRGIMAVPLALADGKLRAEPPRLIAETPALPFFPDPRRMTVLDVAADLDGDRIEELVLPCQDGHRVVKTGAPDRSLPLPPAERLPWAPHRFLLLSFALPRLTATDFDGDGRPDLVGGRDGTILVYRQKDDGEFALSSTFFAPLAPRPPDEERTTPLLADVDGDGRTDLLLVQTPSRVGLFEKFTSQQTLFLNPEIFSPDRPGDPAPPASSFKVNGLAINPTLLDFDGDGDLDLMITALDVDMKSRLLKSVGADYMLFRFDTDARGFERQPHFRLRRPFPGEQLEKNSTAPVCFFAGDFDGDGLRDLVDIADSGAISITTGTTDTGILSSDRYGFRKEVFRAEAGVENDVLIADLNGDGASDLAAWRGNLVFVVRSVK
jgi:hypothetical protein